MSFRLIAGFLLTLTIFGLGAWYFSAITSYFLVAVILSTLLKPATNAITSIEFFNISIPRSLAVVLSLSAFVLLIYYFLLLFVPLIAEQSNLLLQANSDSIFSNLKVPISRLEDFLTTVETLRYKRGSIGKYLGEALEFNLKDLQVGKYISQFLDLTSSLLIAILAIAFITFFLLLERGILKRTFLNFIPNAYFELTVATLAKIEKLLSSYLLGLGIQMVSVFTIAAAGFHIVGLDYPLTVAAFVAVVNLIPYLGPIIGMGFASLVAASTGVSLESSELVFKILKVVGVLLVVQGNDNFVLQPLIFSRSVKAHPLEIFVVIFAGSAIAGVLGMILAIPVYTILRVSFTEINKGYKEYRVFKLKRTYS